MSEGSEGIALSDLPKKMCRRCGVAPRHTTSSGVTRSYCLECARAIANEHNARKREVLRKAGGGDGSPSGAVRNDLSVDGLRAALRDVEAKAEKYREAAVALRRALGEDA